MLGFIGKISSDCNIRLSLQRKEISIFSAQLYSTASSKILSKSSKSAKILPKNTA